MIKTENSFKINDRTIEISENEMFHSHSFFGWKGYFHLVDLQCKIQNATGTELWNLYEEQHKIMYDYIDRI